MTGRNQRESWVNFLFLLKPSTHRSLALALYLREWLP